MDYADQYKHPKWQKKRLEILSLHNYKCESCGSGEKQLQIHHVIYRRKTNIWDYDNSEYMCLCYDCHAYFHGVDDKIKEALSLRGVEEKLIVLGFLSRLYTPMFLENINKESIEFIWGAICSQFLGNEIFKFFEHAVLEDINKNRLDEMGESPSLDKLFIKVKEAISEH